MEWNGVSNGIEFMIPLSCLGRK